MWGVLYYGYFLFPYRKLSHHMQETVCTYIVGYPKLNPVQTIFSIGSDMCVLNEVWDETSVKGGAAMLL